ncbi:asparaginase [Gluconobacter wancherniae]|uniref:Asparaginase n=1 Tax=Gluconobacter wancherniae NBRC 103581 TaxID=656744 RepID=A0A511B2Q0_9PROT|nr:asparaginase [Gluconobacter wancherniae]MBF0854234.1 asparaginase [Gluconobacter wancherniae]MBS1088636.1 asparaginase [Gluconobacter wancherniae]GBD57292.1 asparaginase [Gluconobacter wancherniae NBRC 103581]GEK93933.1 asparaginase [Gluconobacter wancherniae NBRC 103581]
MAGNGAAGLLAEVTRGGRVESWHLGRAVVVDADGRIVWSSGDVEDAVFPRSTVKSLLAIELVESGAADRLRLGDDALALACASHGGEAAHAAVAASMLASVGRDMSSLECGAHWPLYEPAARAWAVAGHDAPCPLHNNCSGKHAGLVCLACDQGVDPAGYIDPRHEIQRRVTDVLEAVTGAHHGDENRGIDGCSMPTYAIPLRALAHGFARFGTGAGLSQGRAHAVARLRKAVAADPFMVAGTGRYDTKIMNHFGERTFIKMGAEGVMVASLPEEGLGIAVKTNDGANRAAEVAMSALLQRFGAKSVLKTDADRAVLAEASTQIMRNWQGRIVGELRSAIEID